MQMKRNFTKKIGIIAVLVAYLAMATPAAAHARGGEPTCTASRTERGITVVSHGLTAKKLYDVVGEDAFGQLFSYETYETPDEPLGYPPGTFLAHAESHESNYNDPDIEVTFHVYEEKRKAPGVYSFKEFGPSCVSF